MSAWELLNEAIDLLCGATSGFIRGSQKDCEWENRHDALLRAYANAKRIRQPDKLGWWFRLPLKVRQHWWQETDYGKKEPSPELKDTIASYGMLAEARELVPKQEPILATGECGSVVNRDDRSSKP